ncbi:ADP-ribosylglycohydrolase family protein [Amycolatopsis sp. NBC_00345]|uniref:ADP-ribosylglycohydrolase family protein n=1 Tax=Amycolatopsis sp. NBC_00345 TaxID=2975955 RepID=UPI003FA4C7EF
MGGMEAHRLRGSLLAGAIGDALGARVEFDSMDRIREIAGPAGITGFLSAYGGEGRFTDDTQMTLFTLEALVRAHAQRRRAPGLTCFGELEAYGRSGIRGGVDRPVNNSKGCGAAANPTESRRTRAAAGPLVATRFRRGCGRISSEQHSMRVAPVALWSDDLSEVFGLAAEAAALTHGHPSGYLSAGTFAVIVHELLLGKPLLDAVGTARAELVRHPGHEEADAALEQALAAPGPDTAAPAEPERLEALGRGDSGETALAMSVYVALTTEDAESALLAAVNHGGDSDSTGSVCGNLVGAMYGEDALPPGWLDRLELREVITELADDAVAEFGPDAPSDDRWSSLYPVD